MILFNYYADNIDYTWFKSSNVVYSKCIDNVDQLKTLIVVFNNGGTYQYEDIPVQDYLMFRNAESQGKALNEIIKKGKYKYTKLEPTNLELLQDEYLERSGNNYLLVCDSNGIIFKKPDETLLYRNNVQLSDEVIKVIEELFGSIGIKVQGKQSEDVE